MSEKGRILFVDDERLLLLTLAYKLGQQGYQVRTAESGKEALRLLADNEYDLVLLDIMLSDINGITVLEAIKQSWPDTIVIMITGHASLDTAIKALRLGAYDYITKPIDDHELRIRIERGISRRQELRQKKWLYEQIARSKWLLQTTIDGLEDGLVLLDREHRILSLNRKAIDIRGIEFSSAVGEKYCRALWNLRDSCWECPIKEAGPDNKRTVQEKVWQGGVDKRTFLEIKTHPILDEGEGLLYIIVYERDLTEEKTLMDHLIRSEKLAELGKMATAIAHELNNYLNGISLRLQWIPALVQKGQIERGLSLMDDIMRYVDGMSRFAKGLVDMGQTTPRMEECNLNELICRVIEFLKPLNKFDRIRFTQQLATNLPTLWIDPSQMEQVFINLLNNAAEAMGEGEITVATRVLAENSAVEILIRDQGPGIPREDFPKIFKPYFTTKEGGHGLGLAICYNIIKAHGGLIEVDSDLGKGTVFIIRLPLDRK